MMPCMDVAGGFRGIMTGAKTQGDDCFPRSTKSKNLLCPVPTSLRRLLRFMHANKAWGVHEKKNPKLKGEEKKKNKTIHSINNLLHLPRLFPGGSLWLLAPEYIPTQMVEICKWRHAENEVQTPPFLTFNTGFCSVPASKWAATLEMQPPRVCAFKHNAQVKWMV